jgi:hypothetical protein
MHVLYLYCSRMCACMYNTCKHILVTLEIYITHITALLLGDAKFSL